MQKRELIQAVRDGCPTGTEVNYDECYESFEIRPPGHIAWICLPLEAVEDRQSWVTQWVRLWLGQLLRS